MRNEDQLLRGPQDGLQPATGGALRSARHTTDGVFQTTDSSVSVTSYQCGMRSAELVVLFSFLLITVQLSLLSLNFHPSSFFSPVSAVVTPPMLP